MSEEQAPADQDDVADRDQADTTGEDRDGQGPFDLVQFRELVEMMEQHGLTEVHLRRGNERWQVRRGGAEVTYAAPQPVYQQPVASQPPAATPAPAGEAPAPKAVEGQIIKSEAVGTFYISPTPDDPPFVTVGARVEADTIVCLIEAMKVFNQIPAGLGGVIAEVLVNNGDAVEFGTPLFRVTSG